MRRNPALSNAEVAKRVGVSEKTVQRARATASKEWDMDIDLSTDAPPEPASTLKLAETLAEIVRTLNHRTRHHEALKEPAEADRLIRELSSAASRLPQLLSQIGSWLEREDAAERIAVPCGEHAGSPGFAVAAVAGWLSPAAHAAAELQGALDRAASVTCTLAAAETEGDDGDERS